MRLLRRNTTAFQYRAYSGETETMVDGRHTGIYVPTYATAVEYRGTISVPTGFASNQLFGIDTEYSHVLLMDNPSTPVTEAGLIDWRGETYEIKAVKPSLNVLSIALKKRTTNNAPTPTPTTDPTPTEPTNGQDDGQTDGTDQQDGD